LKFKRIIAGRKISDFPQGFALALTFFFCYDPLTVWQKKRDLSDEPLDNKGLLCLYIKAI